MAVPNEGTTTLPSDAGTRYFHGLWDPTASAFYAARGSYKKNIIASGPYTTTQTAPVQYLYNARAVIFMVSVTANSGGGSILPRMYSQTTGGYNWDFIIPDVITSTSADRYVYIICPGADIATTAATQIRKVVSCPVPDNITLYVTVNSGTWTFSVDLQVVAG